MPDGTGGGGEGSGNQYGGGDRNGGNNTGFAFNNNNAPSDSAPAPAAPAAPSGDAPTTRSISVGDTDSGLSAVSPFAAFSQVTRSPEQQAFFDRHVGATAARDAYSEAYRTLQEQGPVSPLDQAKLIKDYVKTTEDKWTKPATKNSEAVERNDLKFTVSPGDLTGQPLDRQVLKALSEVGLGGVYGVSGNPNQSAENVVAAQNVDKFLTTAIDIAKNFMPGYGVAMFVANLLSGKMTVGQAFASILGDKVAGAIGIPTSLFRAAYNAEAGNGVAGVATNALNSYISSVGKIDPRITGTFLSQTPLSSTLKSSLSSLNGGPNVAGAVAGTVDSALSNIGIGNGPATTSVNVPYTGTDMQSQVDNILNPSRISPTTAPISLDRPASSSAPSTPLSSAGTSSGSYAGASPDMSTLGSNSNVYRIGNTNYTPYDQKLAQLNLAPDEFTKQSDIGNIPVYSTDINKMANASFTQANDPYAPYTQYAAAGGSIRHFSGAGAVYEDDPAGGTPATPTADQLEKRSALQAQAEYYKNLDAEKQNADIMSSLRNLSGLGGAEATPQKAQIMHLGQVGQYTPPKVLPQLAALLQARGMRLAEGGQPDDHRHPNYDGTPVFRTGGLSGLGGKYVEGKGDGTSDGITAMLADGEYVFSADVVSALGNGSNKAGAQVLDKTVEAIRSRARSTPPDKLPPDAKSPLEYMQSAKGKKHG